MLSTSDNRANGRVRVPLLPASMSSAANEPRYDGESSFRRDLFWLSAGNIVYGFCQWVVILIIARLGTPGMVGQFSLAQAITVPIISFFGLQLRMVQVADQSGAYTFGDYLLVRLLSSAAGLATVCGVALSLRADWETTIVVLVIGVAHTSAFISDIYLGLYQRHRMMRPSGVSSAARGLLAAACLTAILWATRSLVYASAGFAVACITVLLTRDCRAPGRLRLGPDDLRFRLRNVRPLLRAALPLGIVLLLTSLNSNIPRYFIHAERGSSVLGVFSALASAQAAGFLLVSALGQVMVPRLSQAYEAGDLARFRKMLLLVLIALAVLCSAGIVLAFLFGDSIVSLLFGPAYAGQNETFVALLVGASLLFGTSILSCAATALEKRAQQALAMASVTGMTALCCYMLVPAKGGFGAALSGVASSALSFVLMAVTCRKALANASARRATTAGAQSHPTVAPGAPAFAGEEERCRNT